MTGAFFSVKELRIVFRKNITKKHNPLQFGFSQLIILKPLPKGEWQRLGYFFLLKSSELVFKKVKHKKHNPLQLGFSRLII